MTAGLLAGARPAAATSSAALELRGVTKRFGGLTALRDVSLTVAAGSVHCILGENGAGKSTLCNIVFGVIAPDAGEVVLGGEAFAARRPADALARGVAMVHQHFALVAGLTVAENLALGRLGLRRPGRAVRERITALSDRYGLAVDPAAQVDELSVGERQRVELVKALMHEPRLLVLDEPTAVLAPTDIRRLLAICRRLAADGCSVVLVTHKLGEVAEVCDEVSVLREGRLVASVPRAQATPAVLIRLMVGGSLSGSAASALGLSASPSGAATGGTPVGPARLELDSLCGGAGPHGVALESVDLHVGAGEIVAIAGVEGNGQSELAQLVAGARDAQSGRVRLDGVDVTGQPQCRRARLGLAVIPEDRQLEACVLELTVAENLVLGDLRELSRGGLLRHRAIDARAAAQLARWDVRSAGIHAPLATLSGGNQQRVVLARELSRSPLTAVLAAQPTRGLDIGAVVAVLDRLREVARGGGAVLLISSELDELLAIADRVLVMSRGRLSDSIDPSDPAARDRVGVLMSGTPA